MNQTTLMAFGVMALVIIILAIIVMKLNMRISKMLQGKDSKNLEDTMNFLIADIKRMNTNQDITERTLKNMNTRIRKSLTGFKTVRFNPFPDQGGNQSFAIAAINEIGDGFIISSLYTQAKTSVFAKPVKNHTSEFELTTEEKEALDKAK